MAAMVRTPALWQIPGAQGADPFWVCTYESPSVPGVARTDHFHKDCPPRLEYTPGVPPAAPPAAAAAAPSDDAPAAAAAGAPCARVAKAASPALPVAAEPAAAAGLKRGRHEPDTASGEHWLQMDLDILAIAAQVTYDRRPSVLEIIDRHEHQVAVQHTAARGKPNLLPLVAALQPRR